jgi:hypothetical protein
MKDVKKKPLEGRAGDRAYPSLVLAACLSLFLITVSFHFYRVVLCAVEHLVP